MIAAQSSGDAFKGTGSAAGGSATVTQAGVSGKRHYITDISASSDRGTAVVQVKEGSTVIWQDRIGNASPYEHAFIQPLALNYGSAAVITVDGVTVCYANISGFTV